MTPQEFVLSRLDEDVAEKLRELWFHYPPNAAAVTAVLIVMGVDPYEIPEEAE